MMLLELFATLGNIWPLLIGVFAWWVLKAKPKNEVQVSAQDQKVTDIPEDPTSYKQASEVRSQHFLKDFVERSSVNQKTTDSDRSLQKSSEEDREAESKTTPILPQKSPEISLRKPPPHQFSYTASNNFQLSKDISISTPSSLNASLIDTEDYSRSDYFISRSSEPPDIRLSLDSSICNAKTLYKDESFLRNAAISDLERSTKDLNEYLNVCELELKCGMIA
jgi:hypothetical protein